MKSVALVFVLLLGMYTVASAGAPWKQEEAVRELGWFVLHVADWKQTRYAAKSTEYWEVNPILGRDPTLREVDRFFIVTAGLHWLLSDILSTRDRRNWQWISIGVKGAGVWWNQSIGVKLQF